MKKKEWVAYNYCIGFIDLLGQREEYKDEGFLPQFASDEERKAFLQKIKRTIGPIFDLQKDADDMMQAALSPISETKRTLPPELHDTYDKMQKTRIKRQRWSDGLVFFACLGDPDIKCPTNALYYLFALTGSMCFLGLAKKRPIRGAIDIAWGVELHDNELYGAAVAKAYELESYVAQYPRIVVSDRTINYLEVYRQINDNDYYSQCNQRLAEICLNLVAQDVDGQFFIHYLGNSFKDYISQSQHDYLYQKAAEFIQGQCERYRSAKGNKLSKKLSFRYSHLLSYFMAHPFMEAVDDIAKI